MKKLHTLDQALRSLSSPIPGPISLPIAHLSVVRWFDSIAKHGRLVPTRCDVFKKNLLYFSYGGIHYRTANKQSENAVELPVAFLFDPTVLNSIERYYPFDTGAIAKRNMGKWTKSLRPLFKRTFKVAGGDYRVPAKMVHYVYGSNQNYLKGEVDTTCSAGPDPLPLLFRFLSSNLSSFGVDHRQRMIEGQRTKPLSLTDGLVWLGYPESRTMDYTPLLRAIYERTKPSLPCFYPYSYYKNFNPIAIAELLHGKAAEFIQHYIRFS